MNYKKIISFLLFFLFLWIYNFYQISRHKLEKVELESAKITRNLRITQISDFHANGFIDLERLVGDIENYDPDFLVLTGDIIDSRNMDIGKSLELLDSLLYLDKDIYFVSGNHELANKNYERFLKEMEKRQVEFLDNRRVYLEEYNLALSGVRFGLDRQDYRSLEGSLDLSNYNIILSHSPKYPIEYSQGREDLIITGHTHGGQVRLPFIGALINPAEGFFPKYDKGLYNLDGTILYIDSGLGNSLINLRFLNRVQISNISLKKI